MTQKRPSGNFLGRVSDDVKAFLGQRRQERQLDLVLEGGGVKGLALVGALSVLEGGEFTSQRVAGTSAGAIVAALHVAGYTTQELKTVMLALDFNAFKDKAGDDETPLNMAITFAQHKGIYKGEFFLAWLRNKLEAQGVRSFADMPKLEGQSKLQVIVSDTTLRRLLVLPRDAELLGVQPDDLEVALAVRMSMSIPGFFQPVEFVNPQSGQAHLIVDGGLLSNFPIWLFDRQGAVPRWPTFGLALTPELEAVPKIKNISATQYAKNLISTMLEAHDRFFLEQADWARTIEIPTLGVGTVDFGIPEETKLALYKSGQRAAREFVKTWDFAEYIAAFRLPEYPQEVLAEVRPTDSRGELS